MKLLQEYLLKNLSSLFFQIFLTIFVITSIIFFIKIANVTSLFKVSFLDLLYMYLFILPTVLFYTIPISFFASSTLSLAKLSSDSELLVLFSLGLSPTKLLKIFFYFASLASIFSILLSIFLIPITTQLNEQFLDEKKNQTNLNIKASEFGQMFGNWLIFINEDKNGKSIFSNIILYSKTSKDENFIIANDVKIEGKNGLLELNLKNGKGFNLEENSIKQINYQSMTINDLIKQNSKSYKNFIDYWGDDSVKKRKRDLAISIITSLFPLMSIFLIVSFGIYNPRYQKNLAILYIFTTVILFYIIVFISTKNYPISSIFVIPAIWLIISMLIYKKKIEKI